jgi:hypothetical protein
MTRHIASLGLGLVALTGCGLLGSAGGGAIANGVAQARGQQNLSVDFQFGGISGFVPGGSAPGSVTLGSWSHGGPASTCVVLGSDTTLTFNGQALGPESLGTAGDGICEVPQWAVDGLVAWPTPSVSIVITDGSGTIEADYVNVNVPRTVSLLAPAGGTGRVGDTITVQLSPATDVFPADENDDEHFGWLVCEFGVLDAAPDGGSNVGADASATFRGGVATCVVPQGAAGSTEFFMAESGTVGTSRCDVGHCDMDFYLKTPVIPLTIVN